MQSYFKKPFILPLLPSNSSPSLSSEMFLRESWCYSLEERSFDNLHSLSLKIKLSNNLLLLAKRESAIAQGGETLACRNCSLICWSVWIFQVQQSWWETVRNGKVNRWDAVSKGILNFSPLSWQQVSSQAVILSEQHLRDNSCRSIWCQCAGLTLCPLKKGAGQSPCRVYARLPLSGDVNQEEPRSLYKPTLLLLLTNFKPGASV